jgi:purine nucleosidase
VAALPLIFDCDPGVDDAVALFLAFAAPDALDLLAITTVGGNVDVAQTARNARIIRQRAGRDDVPVYAGAGAPLARAPVAASHFHGESGLGDLPVFEPSVPLAPGEAADAIVDLVMGRPPGAVTLAVTGPMTNLALALRREPRLAARLGPVVAMGGARSQGGNITASAEYNIFADPHAAQAVVRATPARVAAIGAIDTVAGRTVSAILDFCVRTQKALVGWDSPPLHDPCVIAYLLAPHLFTLVLANVQVETQSPLTQGHTAVEFRLQGRAPANARWATAADADGVFALLIDRLARR